MSNQRQTALRILSILPFSTPRVILCKVLVSRCADRMLADVLRMVRLEVSSQSRYRFMARKV